MSVTKVNRFIYLMLIGEILCEYIDEYVEVRY